MEGFWDYGDLAQTIAFPFEVIGCALVAWEIFTPKVADRIEGWMGEMTDLKKWQQQSLSSAILSVSVLIFIYTVLFLLPSTTIINTIFDSWHTPEGTLESDAVSDSKTLALILITGMVFGMNTFVPLFIYWKFDRVFSFLDHISGGKPLGALGFFLALIGLTCELYQYTGNALQECGWFMSTFGACTP